MLEQGSAGLNFYRIFGRREKGVDGINLYSLGLGIYHFSAQVSGSKGHDWDDGSLSLSRSQKSYGIQFHPPSK